MRYATEEVTLHNVQESSNFPFLLGEWIKFPVPEIEIALEATPVSFSNFEPLFFKNFRDVSLLVARIFEFLAAKHVARLSSFSHSKLPRTSTSQHTPLRELKKGLSGNRCLISCAADSIPMNIRQYTPGIISMPACYSK